jgi:LPXTG-motif cell wall-anchored protein
VDDAPVDTTHIWWFSNWRDDDGKQISDLTYDTQLSDKTNNDLQPNQAIPILAIDSLIGESEDFEGYTFKGWARVPVAGPNAVDVTSSTFNANDYMYLFWDGSNFHVDSVTGQPVTEVAADENQPYHDMYAVWDINKYTVTVTKRVVGVEEDQHRGFVFDPDFTNYTGTGYDTNFILAGEQTTGTNPETGDEYTYYTIQRFTDVPYGATLTLTESDEDNFTTTVKYTVTSNVDGTPIADPQTENSTDGATYTIHGDITIAYTNTRSTQDVEIQKVSVEDPNEVLEGAVFKINGPNFVDTYYISNSSGYLVPATVTENADGTYSYAITNPASTVTKLTLPTGTYTLTEVKAPDGYLLMEGPVSLVVTTDEVQVEQQGNTHTYSNDNSSGDAILVEVTNTAGAELPMTGGTGTLKYTLGGLVMMAGALVYGFGLRRRRERRFNE